MSAFDTIIDGSMTPPASVKPMPIRIAASLWMTWSPHGSQCQRWQRTCGWQVPNVPKVPNPGGLKKKTLTRLNQMWILWFKSWESKQIKTFDLDRTIRLCYNHNRDNNKTSDECRNDVKELTNALSARWMQ
jgi:hypothetical protein